MLGKDTSWIKRSLLAFPLGVSAFIVSAYAMLVIGIPYNTMTVSLIWALEAAIALFLNRKSYAAIDAEKLKHMLIVTAVVAAAGAISVSGLAPVSISNDSMYYFKRYPDCIVYFEGLRDQFDFFLTDTGLGIVSFDTLPALYGFGETFGIREFFHINFLAIFAHAVYDRAKKNDNGGRFHIFTFPAAAAIVVTAVLAISTPFVILGHWALANMYFMEMFFIAAYTAKDDGKEGLWAQALLMIALSLFRIEGTIFVVWLVLTVSLYTDKGKELVKRALIPMIVLFGGYCLKIFTQFYIFDNIYLFMTPAKSCALIGAMAASGLYIIFAEPLLKRKVRRWLPLFYILALLAGNAALLVSDSAHYIGNLSAFRANLFRQSGWGLLPYFAISSAVIIVAEFVIRRIRTDERITVSDTFSITLTVGFILMVLAASFGRGDVLAEDLGDSGNRVMLQVVPLVIMMFAELFFDLLENNKEQG
ncbi:MAG: hypothetical protein K6F73_09370, partial [Lachnospiraceae bacterium]|nr:hypothetical protein [Lachnospiraceae bacterium]